MRRLLLALGACLSVSTLSASGICVAQDAGFDSPSKPKSYIVYDAEPQTIAAGKKAVVEMHFKVLDGFHVNSHTPKSELLIPTKLTLDAADGVKAEALVYPAGTPYSFSFDPNEKLDVYSGSFIVKLPVVAVAGEHKIAGTLHYQACDHAACYPPKNLPVQVFFTAK
jgi:DsbC/DsbD-like thiol-disulfide interchange protein